MSRTWTYLANLLHHGKKRRRRRDPDEIPRSWRRQDLQDAGPGKGRSVIIKHKKRIPGLLWFKRILAGFLLLINFTFSQFMLGSLGAPAQPMFILFLANSFILLDYLWKTRRGAQQ
ncbi:MAG: hypothetical protein MUP17_09475 [candidate division Zixibacteria bacterium]|nr:hypothetical protein [candidate division Zixibacteria bacterium]